MCIVITTIAQSQNAKLELISVAGDSYKNSTAQLNWSIGECITETFIRENFIVTQGFHQSEDKISSIEIPLHSNIKTNAYPNPTNNFITIEFQNSSITDQNKQITVFDLQGRILIERNVNNNQEVIDFTNLSAGTYLLIVNQNKEQIYSCKVLKSN